MAVLVSRSKTSLSTTNGFQKVLYAKVSTQGEYDTGSLSTGQTLPFTATEAGSVKGVAFGVYSYAPANDRNLRVKLQENVSGTWIDRRAKEVGFTDLVNYYGNAYGTYYFCVDFDTSYAINTTANKWRVFIQQFGGTTGTMYLLSNGAPSFIVYATATTSFADEDCLIVGEDVTIDRSCIFGVVDGQGVVVCSNKALKWKKAPVASYTMTLRGYMTIHAEGEFSVGSQDVPNPEAGKAIIVYDTAHTPLTGVRNYIGSASRTQYKARFELYGSKRSYLTSKLTTDAVGGQPFLFLEDSVDWVAGDLIQITHANRFGYSENAVYEIANVTGNIVTLTTNIASGYTRLAGATVCLFTGRGVKLTTTLPTVTYTNAFHSKLTSPTKLVLEGVEVDDMPWVMGYQASTTYVRMSYDPTYERAVEMRMEDCSVRFSQTTNYNTGQFHVPTTGALAKGNVFFRAGVFTLQYAIYRPTFKSGIVEISNNISIYQYAVPTCNVTTLVKYLVKNNIWSNCHTSLAIAGLNSVYEGNEVYMGSTSGNYRVLNPVGYRGLNNKSRKCYSTAYHMTFFEYTTVDGQETGWEDDRTGVSTVGYNAGALVDFLFDTPFSPVTQNADLVVDTIVGSKLRVTNGEGIPNNDRVFTTFGNFQRCGDSLDDTTVHTAGTGKYSLRFKPGGDVLEWEQIIPTGNIQNKVMMFGVWCKISSSDYWDGVSHQMPRIVARYDDSSEVYAEAAQTTDWQFLFMPVIPLTTKGTIKLALTAFTEMDEYVYFDDMSVLYPAGYQLNLGGLDNWVAALPITPCIATNLSAQDVWAVQTSSFGAGTAGEKLNKIRQMVDDAIVLGLI